MPLLDDILRGSLPPIFDESQLANSLSFDGIPDADGNLILPSSQSASLGGFVLPGADSVSGAPRPSSLFAREDEPMLGLDLDIGFNFNADGELQIGPALGAAQQTPPRGLMPSDGNASARVREEHAAGPAGAGFPVCFNHAQWLYQFSALLSVSKMEVPLVLESAHSRSKSINLWRSSSLRFSEIYRYGSEVVVIDFSLSVLREALI